MAVWARLREAEVWVVSHLIARTQRGKALLGKMSGDAVSPDIWLPPHHQCVMSKPNTNRRGCLALALMMKFLPRPTGRRIQGSWTLNSIFGTTGTLKISLLMSLAPTHLPSFRPSSGAAGPGLDLEKPRKQGYRLSRGWSSPQCQRISRETET